MGIIKKVFNCTIRSVIYKKYSSRYLTNAPVVFINESNRLLVQLGICILTKTTKSESCYNMLVADPYFSVTNHIRSEKFRNSEVSKTITLCKTSCTSRYDSSIFVKPLKETCKILINGDMNMYDRSSSYQKFPEKNQQMRMKMNKIIRCRRLPTAMVIGFQCRTITIHRALPGTIPLD